MSPATAVACGLVYSSIVRRAQELRMAGRQCLPTPVDAIPVVRIVHSPSAEVHYAIPLAVQTLSSFPDPQQNDSGLDKS